MNRHRHPLAWFCYHVGDWLESNGCPTLARGVDWVWRKLP